MRTDQVLTRIRDDIQSDLLRDAELRFPEGVPEVEIRRAALLSHLPIDLASSTVRLPPPTRDWTKRDFQALEGELLKVLDAQSRLVGHTDVPDYIFGTRLVDIYENKVRATVKHLISEFATEQPTFVRNLFTRLQTLSNVIAKGVKRLFHWQATD